MRRPYAVLVSAALCAISVMVTPAVARGQQVRTPSPLDSIAAQLVELELQRLSSAAVSRPEVGSPRDASSQIATLHDRLRALPDGAAAEREATSRVLLALGARASTVQARVQQLRLVYTDDHPVVRQARAEERAIDQRLVELRGTR